VSTPGDRLDDSNDLGGGGIAIDQFTDVGLDGSDVLRGGGTKRCEMLFGDRAAGSLDLVGERGALLN
jgi:hypothetical protein